jgi:hypothetical protein
LPNSPKEELPTLPNPPSGGVSPGFPNGKVPLATPWGAAPNFPQGEIPVPPGAFFKRLLADPNPISSDLSLQKEKSAQISHENVSRIIPSNGTRNFQKLSMRAAPEHPGRVGAPVGQFREVGN